MANEPIEKASVKNLVLAVYQVGTTPAERRDDVGAYSSLSVQYSVGLEVTVYGLLKVGDSDLQALGSCLCHST